MKSNKIIVAMIVYEIMRGALRWNKRAARILMGEEAGVGVGEGGLS